MRIRQQAIACHNVQERLSYTEKKICFENLMVYCENLCQKSHEESASKGNYVFKTMAKAMNFIYKSKIGQ
jgi:hypothetical protein